MVTENLQICMIFFFLWDSEQQPYNDLKMCLDVHIQVLSCKFFNIPVAFIHGVSWLTSTGLLMQRKIWIGSCCICPVTQIVFLLFGGFLQNKGVFSVVIKSTLNTWLHHLALDISTNYYIPSYRVVNSCFFLMMQIIIIFLKKTGISPYRGWILSEINFNSLVQN